MTNNFWDIVGYYDTFIADVKEWLIGSNGIVPPYIGTWLSILLGTLAVFAAIKIASTIIKTIF